MPSSGNARSQLSETWSDLVEPVRLTKELILYRKEEAEAVQKVDKLKADGADDADVRQAVRFLM